MMITQHKIVFGNAHNMSTLGDESIDLVVTSPPYPMIEMWDDSFSQQNSRICESIETDPNLAFELMHQELDKIWKELYRVTKPGGIVCINIGDATRTIKNEFKIYSNHSRILNYFLKIGFSNLPNILWRKQTNAPNKFMGSGMLPPGAYVTLEHEYILIFRKGSKRVFKTNEAKLLRKNSAFFWEERNKWFSDLWDLKGTSQKLRSNGSRNRSGAFPFEVVYRLINMFSVKGDIILDPFLGTATTTLGAIASCRSSIGYEIESNLSDIISSTLSQNAVEEINKYIRVRINNHKIFVKDRIDKFGQEVFKHINSNYKFPVISAQETDIIINYIESLAKMNNGLYESSYISEPIVDYFGPDSLFSKCN